GVEGVEAAGAVAGAVGLPLVHAHAGGQAQGLVHAVGAEAAHLRSVDHADRLRRVADLEVEVERAVADPAGALGDDEHGIEFGGAAAGDGNVCRAGILRRRDGWQAGDQNCGRQAGRNGWEGADPGNAGTGTGGPRGGRVRHGLPVEEVARLLTPGVSRLGDPVVGSLRALARGTADRPEHIKWESFLYRKSFPIPGAGSGRPQRGGGVIKTAADAVSGPHPSPPQRAGEGAGVWT